jgi:hypothetical protein
MIVTNSATGSSMNTSTTDQARLVIVGATGMVGGYALRYALEHAAVGTVTAIGRRRLGISHARLREVLHQDFADCSALAAPLSGQGAAIFCLHIYRSGVRGGTPQGHRGLYDRVRACSPPQQPRRGILILKRGWRRPDGTKSHSLRAIQGTGRKCAYDLAIIVSLGFVVGRHIRVVNHLSGQQELYVRHCE